MTDHYLYVIAFSDKVVKVGRTTNAQVRFSTHAYAAMMRGAEVARDWISPTGCEYGLADSNERQLIAYCKDRWPIAWGREYFAAANFDEIAKYAAGLRGLEIQICPGGHCRQTFADERPYGHMHADQVSRLLAVSVSWVKDNYQSFPHHHCGSQICFTAQEVVEGIQARSNCPLAA